MPIIIYNTNTGTTEKYAKALSEKTGYECVSYAKSKKIAADEEIIFISWVMAASLDKYKEASERFSNIKLVCGVGMLPDEKNKMETIAKSNITEEYILLPGGFSIKKLTGMHKMLFTMMLNQVKKKAGSAPNEKDLEKIKLFEEGFDLYHEDKLAPVLKFLGVE